MEPLFSELYKDGMSSTIKTRLSNAYLIGEIFGMLFFGYVIDKIGRRTGIFFASKFFQKYTMFSSCRISRYSVSVLMT